jgi:hypothetical protein
MNRRWFALAGVALLSACAQVPSIPTAHRGADAGQVVLGFGIVDFEKPWKAVGYRHIRLLIEREASPSPLTGTLELQSPPLFSPGDYRNDVETGLVQAFSLPAGRYRLTGFQLVWEGGLNGQLKTFTAQPAVALSFTVEAGRAAYLGNYQLHALSERNAFGLPAPQGGVFVVSDRLAADAAIAQRKQLISAAPSNQTPDVASLKHPQLLTPEQNAARLAAGH